MSSMRTASTGASVSAGAPAAMVWRASRGRAITLHPTRPVLMAIVNITPDSFSDGGVVRTRDDAARAAERAVGEGAAIIDIGGESTRPGALRVGAEEQIARVAPAIEAIRRTIGDAAAISIDTTLAPVASAALDAGADAVNDVSAATEDAGMLALCARRGAGIILMHRLAPPERDRYSDRYEHPPAYADVVGEVAAFLAERLRAALGAGIEPDGVALDPGLGFGKSVEQNLALIRGGARLAALGRPIVSGISRKSFTARAAGMGEGTDPADRLAGSLGLSVAHAATGARVWRVHDVAAHARAAARLA